MVDALLSGPSDNVRMSLCQEIDEMVEAEHRLLQGGTKPEQSSSDDFTDSPEPTSSSL